MIRAPYLIFTLCLLVAGLRCGVEVNWGLLFVFELIDVTVIEVKVSIWNCAIPPHPY
jgi:hypothetical protein